MANQPTNLPPSGTPGTFDPRNPTLLPNFDRPIITRETIGHQSPAGAISNGRANASATATLGGSVTTGDILTLEIQSGLFPNGYLSHTVTAGGGDTLSTLADSLANAFNDDPNAAAHGLRVDVAGPILTFAQNGPLGNFSTLSATLSEPTTITVGGTALTNDALSVLFTSPLLPGGSTLITVPTTTGNTPTQMAAALSAAINADAELTAAGISSSPTAAVLAITVPAAEQPLAISAWVNTIIPKATIAGAVAAGDVLNITITNAAIPGGSRLVSYTALLGATTTTLAAAIAAKVNADSVLIAAGIGASSLSNVVSFTYQGVNGQIRFSQSVSPGSETITLSATPTETIAVATVASETITLAPGSGKLSGGTGPIFATNNFEFAPSTGGVVAYSYGQPYDLEYPLLAQMVAQGEPII